MKRNFLQALNIHQTAETLYRGQFSIFQACRSKSEKIDPLGRLVWPRNSCLSPIGNQSIRYTQTITKSTIDWLADFLREYEFYFVEPLSLIIDRRNCNRLFKLQDLICKLEIIALDTLKEKC